MNKLLNKLNEIKKFSPFIAPTTSTILGTYMVFGIITGNTIGSLSINNFSAIGIILFILGILGIYVNVKYK